MTWGRYLLLKMAVGFVLFWASVFPTFYLAGLVATLLTPPVAFALIGLCWVMTMLTGTHLITEKLSKRWAN